MKALIILDAQNGILKRKNFDSVIEGIKELSTDFKSKKYPIILTKHIDNDPDSIIYSESKDGDIPSDILDFSSIIIEKKSPNPFSNEKLEKFLLKNNVSHLFITGFNTEYCGLFTAISAEDRNYKVTFIEDATGTVNDEDTYEMKGLDIQDFVGCVLDWSGIIEVLYLEEYREQYKNE